MHLSPPNAVAEMNRLVNAKDSEIKLHANGGNSVLVTCKPSEEHSYIEEFQSLNQNTYKILGLNSVLVEFVEKAKDDINFYLEKSSESIDQIFRNTITDEPDFFNLILDKIQDIHKENKVPVIINTGVIYAVHFDMLALMESKTIMDAKLPTVFLYPSELDHNNQLRFLNTRIASEYRCKII